MRLNLIGTQLLACLAYLIATDGPFEIAKIGLVENADPVLPTTPIADLEFASYAGYANSAVVVWQTPHTDDDSNAIVQCLPKEFKPTGDTATSTVTQVVLLNTGATAVLASYQLDEPMVFANTMDVQLIGFPLVLAQPQVDIEDIVP